MKIQKVSSFNPYQSLSRPEYNHFKAYQQNDSVSFQGLNIGKKGKLAVVAGMLMTLLGCAESPAVVASRQYLTDKGVKTTEELLKKEGSYVITSTKIKPKPETKNEVTQYLTSSTIESTDKAVQYCKEIGNIPEIKNTGKVEPAIGDNFYGDEKGFYVDCVHVKK